MNDTFTVYTWHNNLYFRWTVLPVLAHLLSWMTGIGGVFLFPVLLTVAQYLILRIHPSVIRPGAWFFTLPVTFYIWLKWGPLPGTYTSGGGIFKGVVGYYVGQLLNTAFIPLVMRKGKPELLLGWLLSQATAFVSWIVLYKVIFHNYSATLEKASFFPWSAWLIYPVIALISNAIGGFILTNDQLILEDKTA